VSHVFSPVTGRVTRILAQPGQRVRRGAPLAVIESPDVGQAFADLGKAQADLTASQHDFDRQQHLLEIHAIALKDLEASEDNFHKAQAELARAEQKARLLRSGAVDRVTQQYTLTAPIDGEVISRSVNPGVEVVGQYSGGNAAELFTVGELDQLWVMADLFEVDLARVQKGAEAQVSVVAYPGHVFKGTVDWVSATLDPATRSAKVRVVVPNDDSQHLLKPEMFASVSISASEKRALAIPRSAVLRMGEQTVVYVQAGEAPGGKVRFERRPVAVNEELGAEFVPVLRGLRPGERIVSSGAILLSEAS
jgi:cobalt-zinc-cadmium efflux system membrane fusion protein